MLRMKTPALEMQLMLHLQSRHLQLSSSPFLLSYIAFIIFKFWVDYFLVFLILGEFEFWILGEFKWKELNASGISRSPLQSIFQSWNYRANKKKLISTFKNYIFYQFFSVSIKRNKFQLSNTYNWAVFFFEKWMQWLSTQRKYFLHKGNLWTKQTQFIKG